MKAILQSKHKTIFNTTYETNEFNNEGMKFVKYLYTYIHLHTFHKFVFLAMKC